MRPEDNTPSLSQKCDRSMPTLWHFWKERVCVSMVTVIFVINKSSHLQLKGNPIHWSKLIKRSIAGEPTDDQEAYWTQRL